MTTWPSNQTPDQSSTATMAAYIPPTVASRAATGFDVTAPTATRPPYVPDLAWSAEPPGFAAPLATERPQSWSMRSSVLTFVGGGLVAAAAAGIFGALHGAQSTPADTTSHSAPAPARAPAPAAAPANPVSTPGNQTKPATPTRSVSHGSSHATSQPQYSTSPSQSQHTNDQAWQNTNDQQWQSNNGSVSTPPTWNRNDFFYWFTHRRDHDGGRWTHDRDSDNRSGGDHGDNSESSHDQSSDNGRSN
jgi:hypothetical protein